jgi:cytochrome c
MRNFRCSAVRGALLAPLVMTTVAMANPAENDVAMLKLAAQRGCMACHTVLPGHKRADGLPPIAPAWRDIAIKYRDDPAASERLTRIVMRGSNPRESHWVGKVSPVTMPPHVGSISQTDARMLVNWILVLVP